jgi:hypothetical protein
MAVQADRSTGHTGQLANPMFRPATIADASVLAELVNYAREGMPLYLWGQLADPGETARLECDG